MQRNPRRYLALTLVLLTGLAVNLQAMRLEKGGHIEKAPPISLPSPFLGFKAEPMEVDEQTKKVLNRASIASARYMKMGDLPVDVLVVSSYDPNDMHRPENCLVGGGFTIVSDELRDVRPEGPQGPRYVFHRLVLRYGKGADAEEMVMVYGYEGLGESGSTDAARFSMMFSGPRDEPAHFVRLSAMAGGDTPGTEKRLLDWASEFLKARDAWKPKKAPRT